MKKRHDDIQERTLRLKPEAGSLPTDGSLPSSEFNVFESRPAETKKVRGGMILIQEIFGVNSHIREVARHYARQGFAVWAPSYFDHVTPGVELPYSQEAIATGREFVAKVKWDLPLRDTKLAAETLRNSLPLGRQNLAVMGYCWGGSLTWLAACRLEKTFAAAVVYYGGQVLSFREEQPTIPTIMHFGKHDSYIPVAELEKLSRAQPSVPIHIYDAGHGFNCNWRSDFNEGGCKLSGTADGCALREDDPVSPVK